MDKTFKTSSHVRDIYKRATRNCPWVGDLWAQYLLSVERGHASEDELSDIDTKDILFICGGAFVGLEKTISERREDSSIGFGAPFGTNMRVGGLTDALVTSSLLEFVLTEPKNACCKQYKQMFNLNNVKLLFTEKALRLIAEKAIAKKYGARGLRSILESILTEAMFEVPGSKPGEESVEVVLVDEEAVETADTAGCGAKVLCGSSGLENISPPTGLTMAMEPKDRLSKGWSAPSNVQQVLLDPETTSKWLATNEVKDGLSFQKTACQSKDGSLDLKVPESKDGPPFQKMVRQSMDGQQPGRSRI